MRSGSTVTLLATVVLAACGWLAPQPGLLAAGGGGAGLVLDGRVTRVLDGDTLEVMLDSGPERIRLYGIDAPEARAPGGRAATQALVELLDRAVVEVEPVSDDPYDAYDRLIALVHVDGVNASEYLVAAGHAWAFRRYLGQLDGDTHYCELEAEARAARRGLWSMPQERWVPPWIWRQRRRTSPGTAVPAPDYAQESAAACVAAIGKPYSWRAAAPAPTGSRAPATSAGRSVGRAGSAEHPPGCDIKGNINRKGQRIYHLPGSRFYEQTQINTANGERWFCNEEEARAAGWRAPR